MATIAIYTRSIDRNLTNEGYKFFPSSIRPDLVIVAKPNGNGAYTVDVQAGTCNCAAGKRGVKCCHLREASAQVAQPKKPTVVITTSAGFGSREAFEKARAADFD